jgi:hypothetical protein
MGAQHLRAQKRSALRPTKATATGRPASSATTLSLGAAPGAVEQERHHLRLKTLGLVVLGEGLVQERA